jgi:hypothetical protein
MVSNKRANTFLGTLNDYGRFKENSASRSYFALNDNVCMYVMFHSTYVRGSLS